MATKKAAATAKAEIPAPTAAETTKPATKKPAAAKTATANVTTANVTISLPKAAVATAKTVVAVGDFNNWNVENATPLKKQKDGSFAATLELEAGKAYQYRFLLNGETWENAWDAPQYVASPFGGDNSVVFA